MRRIQEGARPRVLDLFAGCGGFSLGFETAGFEIVSGLEIDEHATRTHAMHFSRDDDSGAHSQTRDIRETDPDYILEHSKVDSVDSAIDVIVGGPPCQSYARVGRAKLRDVDENPEAFLEDGRGNLYLRYLEYVRALKPLAVVVENVPDALNYGGHNIAEEICEVLDEQGYQCRYTLLNSAFYGVPQMRERMFLVAYAEELDAEVRFPDPTHWIELPSGYHGSRNVALKHVRNGRATTEDGLPFEEEDTPSDHFSKIPQPSQDLPRAITAQQALSDLPDIYHHLDGDLTRGARRFNTLQAYPEDSVPSPYGLLMRNWPGYESEEGIYDHKNGIRNLPRDYKIFRRMEPGDQYPEAHKKAESLFQKELGKRRSRGEDIPDGSEAFAKLKSRIVPPYDPTNFPNKWRKMEADEPARTLTAHIGKDTYSHIHYDSEQARTISVREAARLQSFPDGFGFSGSMNPAFRQIGNAVPPLVAFHLALEVGSAVQFDASDPISSFSEGMSGGIAE
jgi:DNA (cytosine-5)-methyltransferase 1